MTQEALSVKKEELKQLSDDIDAAAWDLPDEVAAIYELLKTTKASIYKAPPQLKPLTREQEIALREGYCADAESSYFDARADCLDTPQNRRLFVAAFERGWQAAHGIKENT